ncbi:glycosyltransferase [Pseudomonas putida]|jgi:glycosyltransferase involved in cell wall biosynthesis|uniref:glycosyltransferase n=1 Tax=Pseudomonas putida TaxID=303 RepID=UPI002363A04F|nr:glycosyltransferase [Pseudomonas putida]MDD1968846.1 glycosyltransferase [Pseudomonas putida]
MAFFPCFLSVVLVVRNQAEGLEGMLLEATGLIASMVSDYELIIVDNASTDDSIAQLKRLTGEDGVANLQVYALTREVDLDTASWVGLENALGDYAVVLDPLADDIAFLPNMLEQAAQGADVVFVCNAEHSTQSLPYYLAFKLFHRAYRWFNGIHLVKEAPQFRLLTRKVISFILQHPKPTMIYRHLPATGGFARVCLSYSAPPKAQPRKHLGESVDRGIRMLISSTRAPMRMVTALSLFGAVMNLIYCAYVVGIALFKTDVAAGWTSLSLQQSGMFFLISLVLLVLGEYILNMASFSNDGPLYYIGQEFTSCRMTRLERLNVEEITPNAHVVRAWGAERASR